MAEDVTQPVWSPGPVRRQTANVRRFIELLRREIDPGIRDYADLHRFSVERPGAFWRAVWDFCGVVGSPGPRVVDDFARFPGARWFPDARLNFAANLLRHRDEHPALVFRGEDGERSELSYAELYAAVARAAAALRDSGVTPGDRVAALMPNRPETVVAMLAATAIGAVFSSCSPEFGVDGVVERFGQIEPDVLFCIEDYAYAGKTHDGLDKVRDVVARIPSIRRTVVVSRGSGEPRLDGIRGGVSWAAFTATDATDPGFVDLPFDHPLYILYSSGTTGAPKCITHGAGGTLVQHLKELVLHVNLRRADRICYYTTCGWMMWNWLVSALAVGATVVLYDGSPFHPGPGALFDLVDAERISVLGVSARAIAAWEKAGLEPRDSHKLNSLVTLLSTGSPLAPASYDYVYRAIKQNLCLSSIAGGTDIVSCFLAGSPILPVYRGELQCAALGMDVRILQDDGSEAAIDETGELCCARPFPATPLFFWGEDGERRYHAAYFEKFPGFWAHGDYAKKTANGGYVIEGRSDATLNPGGVRIGTAEIYRQVDAFDDVLESLCVGQEWDGDVRVLLFVRLRDGVALDETLAERIRAAIRKNASPRHVPARIVQVADIPRTVSGKLVELAVRDVIHGRPVANREALANPEALDLFRDLPELRA